ncbi:MAG: FliO/MopB family protein [Candidatus Nitrospinota bacterium M3_3B_026]
MKDFTVVMALMLAFAAPAQAVDLSGLNRLDGVSVYSDDKEARVVIRFAGDVGKKPRPVFYEKSIQLDMSGVYVNPPQIEFDLGDPFLPKAAAYQLTPEKTRLRLFLAENPREYEARTESSLNGELLILAIRKKEPAPPGPQARTEAEPVEPLPGIEELDGIKKTLAAASASVKNAAEEPAAAPGSAGAGAIKRETNDRLGKLAAMTKPDASAPRSEPRSKLSANGGGNGFLEYRDPEAPQPPSLGGMAVKMAASLSLVLAMIFALAWAAKKYSGRLGGALGQGGVVRILASGSIDMKRRVVVADIAGEVMVIGLSGDSMTMLGVIDDEEKADILRRKSGAAPGAGNGAATPREPSALGRAFRFFRIGSVETAPGAPRALFDESDEETFAGALSRAAGDRSAAPSREELLKNVAGAIRARNKRLGYA